MRPTPSVPLRGLPWALMAALAAAACSSDGVGGPPLAYDGGVSCAQPDQAPRSFPRGTRAVSRSEVDPQGRVVAPADTCDRGAFFIEVAAGAATPCEGFAEAVTAALQERLSANVCHYLGSENEETDAPNRDVRVANGPRPAGVDPRTLCATQCAQGKGPRDHGWGPREATALAVRLEPVFAADAGVPLPAGADRRFFRLSIDAAAAGGRSAPLVFPHGSVCSVLEDIRAAVDEGLAVCPAGQRAEASVCDAVADAAAPTVRIGRECQVTDSGIEARGELLDWHLTRLGPIPAGAERGAKRPRVALLDSGVEAGLGVPAWRVDGTPDTAAPGDPHGSLLAALMRQLDPGIDLASVRALGGQSGAPGLGTTADLARAIWRSLGRTGPGKTGPLILNLSLGWPETLSRPRRVRGVRRAVDPDTARWGLADAPVCDVVEDAPGEAVRYALAMAYHAASQRGDAPATAFAAAGNRSHVLRGQAAASADALGHIDCAAADNPPRLQAAWCDGAQARPEAPLFYPALWGHEGVADNPWAPAECPPAARVVEPVAALDALDLPAAADPAVPQAPLAAPGQQIYAPPAGLSSALVPVGSECDSAALRQRKQALAMSGTSVSAALLSGLASRVQAAALRVRGAPLGGRALPRFLYVTGLAVKGVDGQAATRESLEGLPVRRPNLCRALAALSASCAAEVVACAEAVPEGEVLLGAPDELLACAERAERCLAAVAACPAPAVAPPAPITGYPATTSGSAHCQTSSYDGDPAVGWERTETRPFLRASDRREKALMVAAAGIVGPQPVIPVCPDCLVTYTQSNARLKFVVNVNPKWPVGAKIASPRLVIYDTRSSLLSQTLDLTSSAFTFTPNVRPESWKANTQVVITGPAPVGPGKLDASYTIWQTYMKAELLSNVSGSSQVSAPVDLSLLRLQALSAP